MRKSGNPVTERTSSRQIEELRPAFSSSARALLFLVFLAGVLLLPEIITWSGTIDRRHSYEIMTDSHGAYSFVAGEIFENEEDIDLLFLGSSVMFAGIDTPQVQRALSLELGRPARVVTFGHYFNSVDILYMQLKDVLERKRVQMVVLSLPRVPYPDGPSATGCRFIRYPELGDIVVELPLKYKAALYACGVLRTPRDLLSIIRRNETSISPSLFAEHLGMDKAEIGIGRDPLTFSRFTPASPAIPVQDMILSSRTKGKFLFIDDEIPFYQNLYLEKIVAIAGQKNVPLAMLNIPQYTERQSDKIIERINWSERFSGHPPIIGVPPAVVFAGLSEEEIERLHYDDVHLNANGSEFFTRTVLPAIVEVYKTHAPKNN